MAGIQPTRKTSGPNVKPYAAQLAAGAKDSQDERLFSVTSQALDLIQTNMDNFSSALSSGLGAITAGLPSDSRVTIGSVQVPGASQSTSDFKGTELNVKMFGAFGNGVTDDTVAIRAAISALGASGGTVFAPAGTYPISSTIMKPRNVILRGAGAQVGTTFKWTPTTGTAFVEADGNASNPQGPGAGGGFRNFELLGPGNTYTSSVGILCGADPAGVLTPTGWSGERTFWDNVYITGFGDGVQNGLNSYGQNMYNIRFQFNAIGWHSLYVAAGNFNGPNPLIFHGGLFVKNLVSIMTEGSGATIYFHGTSWEYSGQIQNGGPATTAAGVGVGNVFSFFGCHMEKNAVSDPGFQGPFLTDTNANDSTVFDMFGGFLVYSNAYTPSVTLNPWMFHLTGLYGQIRLRSVSISAVVDLTTVVYLHCTDAGRSFAEIDLRGNDYTSTVLSLLDTTALNRSTRDNLKDYTLTNLSVDPGGPTGAGLSPLALSLRSQTSNLWALGTFYNGGHECFVLYPAAQSPAGGDALTLDEYGSLAIGGVLAPSQRAHLGSIVYDSAHTYGLNDRAASAGVSYISIQAGNLNHTPASSPTWWSVDATRSEDRYWRHSNSQSPIGFDVGVDHATPGGFLVVRDNAGMYFVTDNTLRGYFTAAGIWTVSYGEMLQWLAGGGTQMLTVDNVGNVGAAAIPSGGLTQKTSANPWFLTPTGSRALATVYQNTTGKTVWVSVSVGGALVSLQAINVYCDASPTPTTMIDQIQVIGLNATFNARFPVEPGLYCKLTSSGAGQFINIWTEDM